MQDIADGSYAHSRSLIYSHALGVRVKKYYFYFYAHHEEEHPSHYVYAVDFHQHIEWYGCG